MIFTIFLIIAAWFLPLPLWLQICLTIFGIIHFTYQTVELKNKKLTKHQTVSELKKYAREKPPIEKEFIDNQK